VETQYAEALAFLRLIVDGKRWRDNPWQGGLMGGPPMWDDEREWILNGRRFWDTPNRAALLSTL
jgi:hypothetical protein